MSDQFARLRIPLDKIVSAINNYANEYLIEEDGMLKIYKGKLSLQSDEWIDVSIRRFVGMDVLKKTAFLEKIQFLSILKHRNLISIIGFCDENDECIIVIEHAIYASLDQHLHYPTLTCSQRLQICLGAARAFCYLHQNNVIHGDIRCSRILLNKDWEAKVSCFGLSPQNHLLLTFHNYRGYTLRRKSDLCPFGVMLLEVLCGRKSNFGEVVGDHEALPINPYLRKQIHSQSLTVFLKTVRHCLSDHPPSMFQIAEGLENAAWSWKLKA